jgi:chromosome segregation ATPase
MSNDPKSFLAGGVTLADNAIKSLQEWRGFLDTLSSRVGEIEGLEQRGAAAKQRLNEVRAQLQSTEKELEEMRETHKRMSMELSGPATALHEIRTMLRDVKTN